jgi:hypothetical protein
MGSSVAKEAQHERGDDKVLVRMRCEERNCSLYTIE